MRTVLLCVLQLVAILAVAQRECASTLYRTELYASGKLAKQQTTIVEAFIQKHQTVGANTGMAKMPTGVLRIPVVVHILENGKFTISDDRVRSQIEALNRDFRKKNADTTNIPDRFKHLAADIEIEFALATADPKGRATTGIVRKQTTVDQWNLDDQIKFSSSGGSNAWDTKSYLNIWVGPMNRILGYSSEPGAPANVDGVVIHPNAFGTIGATASFNLGRTATHEVGHWLGLIHMWGDDYCGDDKVEDTPPQSTYTVGCPTGMRQSCNNGPNGTMYMNYMDYANDACMYLFTIGQKNRMRSLFAEGGVRAGLLTSKGLNAPWNSDTSTPDETEEEPQKAPLPAEITKAKVYPNPVQHDFTLQLDASWVGQEIQLLNMNGIIIQQILINNKEQKVPAGSLIKGVYFLKGRNGEQVINEKFVKL